MITHIPAEALRLASIPDGHADIFNPRAMEHSRSYREEADELETLSRIYISLFALALRWPRMTG